MTDSEFILTKMTLTIATLPGDRFLNLYRSRVK